MPSRHPFDLPHRSADHVPVKVVAALLALILSGFSAAPLTCVGWVASASERRECCKRAHHQHCQNQASADTCCAGHEQGRQALSTHGQPQVAGVDHAAALPVPLFDAASLHQAAFAQYAAVYARRLHGPPILLAPPLRI